MSIFDTFSIGDQIRRAEEDNALEQPGKWTKRFAGTKKGKRLINDLIESRYTIPYSQPVAFDDSEVVQNSQLRIVAGQEEKNKNSIAMINKANQNYLNSLLGLTKPGTGLTTQQLLEGIPVTEQQSQAALAKEKLLGGIKPASRVRGVEVPEFKSKQ